MRSEEDKAKIELRMFREFIQKTGLPVNFESITKNVGESEPDIRCEIEHQTVDFELVEICASDIAEAISLELEGKQVFPISTFDPTEEIISKKLRKSYKTSYPVELLCYTTGRAVPTDDLIFEEIRRCSKLIRGQFRKIWLLGEIGVYEVWQLPVDT